MKIVVFLRVVYLELLLLISPVVEYRTTPAPVRFVALLVEVVDVLRILLEVEVATLLEVAEEV